MHWLKLLKNLGCGWDEWPLVCDHLDVKGMSVSNVLGAFTTLECTLNSI